MREVIDRGMAANSGATSISLTLGPAVGFIVARSMWFDSPAAGTITVYRPRQKAIANAAVSGSATLVVKTDASGYIGGAVLTTSDLVLVCSSTGTTWTLQTISNVAAVSSSTVTLTLGGTITCAALDTIYIIRAADVVTFVTADETKTVEYAFNGYDGMPVHLVMAATGTNTISVAYDVEG